jgi:hypothetical protein
VVIAWRRTIGTFQLTIEGIDEPLHAVESAYRGEKHPAVTVPIRLASKNQHGWGERFEP